MSDLLLQRPRQGILIAGVCAALAQRFEVDITLVRVLWIPASCCFGAGAILYLILWAVIPAEE